MVRHTKDIVISQSTRNLIKIENKSALYTQKRVSKSKQNVNWAFYYGGCVQEPRHCVSTMPMGFFTRRHRIIIVAEKRSTLCYVYRCEMLGIRNKFIWSGLLLLYVKKKPIFFYYLKSSKHSFLRIESSLNKSAIHNYIMFSNVKLAKFESM